MIAKPSYMLMSVSATNFKSAFKPQCTDAFTGGPDNKFVFNRLK